MAVQEIDAQLLAKMFLAGAKTLEANKEPINELNVFPVPDGDTGTNMTMTIMSAAHEVVALGDEPEMTALCKAMSSGSLRGARGNSGVILSQLLRGFTKRVRDEQTIAIPLLCEAFTKAVETAYKAVMKPTEGTILTVARGISERADELKEEGCENLETFLTAILEHGQVVLDGTPELLPVLKQAGVVDSGGTGLMTLLRGAVDFYLGKEMDLTLSDQPIAKVDDSRAIRSGEKKAEGITRNLYCTEITIELSRPFNSKLEKDVRSFLAAMGELLDVKVEENTVYLHLHTDDPGLIVQRALKYGILSKVIIQNRNVEGCAAEAAGAQESGSPEGQPTGASARSGESAPTAKEPASAVSEPPAKFGFIAVSAGEGLGEIFRSLGVDCVIEGGQTMNPSTADILDAVDRVHAETIFILPNNKNIIMAAQQASELTTDKTLLVIPTKTIPQGITAAINFAAGLSADENEQTMMEEIGRVKSGEITYAVRDTEIDDKKIRKGDYMGIGDKGILSVGTDMREVLFDMLAAMQDEDSELISIYYGSDVAAEDAEEVRAAVAERFPDCDIELQSGGQPIYYYIVSVE